MSDDTSGALGAIPDSVLGVLVILVLGLALLLLATWLDARRRRKG